MYSLLFAFCSYQHHLSNNGPSACHQQWAPASHFYAVRNHHNTSELPTKARLCPVLKGPCPRQQDLSSELLSSNNPEFSICFPSLKVVIVSYTTYLNHLSVPLLVWSTLSPSVQQYPIIKFYRQHNIVSVLLTELWLMFSFSATLSSNLPL